jgi:PAS domain S-box-containing protein
MYLDTHTSIRVLCVDDDEDVLDVLEFELERRIEDGTVVTAETVAAGTEKLESGEFDCLVADYKLPDGDGFDLVDAAKEVDEDMPILFYTGRGSEDVSANALDEGVAAYVIKGSPGDKDKLAARVESLVAKRRAMDASQEAERRIRNLVERISDAVVSVESDWTITLVNGRTENFFDVDRDGVVGRNFWDVFPSFEESELTDLLHESMETGERVRAHLETGEGDHGEVTAFSDQSGMTLFVHDVTTEVNAEKAIEELEAQHERTKEKFDVLTGKLDRPEAPFR